MRQPVEVLVNHRWGPDEGFERKAMHLVGLSINHIFMAVL